MADLRDQFARGGRVTLLQMHERRVQEQLQLGKTEAEASQYADEWTQGACTFCVCVCVLVLAIVYLHCFLDGATLLNIFVCTEHVLTV